MSVSAVAGYAVRGLAHFPVSDDAQLAVGARHGGVLGAECT
jgi:hypothetical protein